MPNPHHFNSDVDYYEACDPDRVRFLAFQESDDGAFENLLRDKLNLLNEAVWEHLFEQTLDLAMAFRQSQYRPLMLCGWHDILNNYAPDDVINQIPHIDCTPVLDMALFMSLDNMLDEALQAECLEYRQAVFSAACDWEWVYSEFVGMCGGDE